MTFDDNEIERVIPSVFYAITSSQDDQQSNESYNVGKFGLSTSVGKSGSACTSAFLQQQYKNKGKPQTWVGTLKQMHASLQGMDYDQTPMLSSSRKIDLDTPLQIVPPRTLALAPGRRRALLIGVNYVGQEGELKSCHSDCLRIQEFLLNVHGFREADMTILMDDGQHVAPTKANMEDAFIRLSNDSRAGDAVFVSFSGHGGQTIDHAGDEETGFDTR
jgi:hypothetical protein